METKSSPEVHEFVVKRPDAETPTGGCQPSPQTLEEHQEQQSAREKNNELLRATSKVNWAQAFLLFCQGASLKEVSEMTGIDNRVLWARASGERWEEMKKWATRDGHLAVERLLVNDEITSATVRAALIANNRERNYKLVDMLRTDLEQTIVQLLNGELLIEEIKTNKDGAFHVQRRPGIGDRAQLAAYARSIAAMTYEALGDSVTERHADTSGSTRSKGQPASQSAPQVLIVLPGAIAKPRQRGTSQPADVEVVDIEAVAQGGVSPSTEADTTKP